MDSTFTPLRCPRASASPAFILQLLGVVILIAFKATQSAGQNAAAGDQTACPWIASPTEFFPAVAFQDFPNPFDDQASEALEASIKSFIAEASIPYYSVSVVREDETVFSSGLPQTQFLVGSITKVFTALGALILREQGLLSLEDPVTKFLPTFSIINPYGTHNTTLRELMGHLSGLPRECTTPFTGCPIEEADVLGLISQMQLVRPPWSREPAYSNLAFALLGHAWEKATSPPESYDQFMMEKILKKLGMNDSGLDLTTVRLAGYNSTGATDVDTGWLKPAAQLYSTTTDMSKFLIFLLKATPPLISDTSIREWTRSATIFPDRKSGFALPWELLLVNSTSEFLITKGGALANFRSFIGVHTPTQLGVSVFTVINENSTKSADALGLLLFDKLIPAVEEANAKIINPHYTGLYICDPSTPTLNPFSNLTIGVVGGNFTVAATPSTGLYADLNITLLVEGVPVTSDGRVQLLLKNATENSFWYSGGESCVGMLSSLSAVPSPAIPNFPGSPYLSEIVFDEQQKAVSFPGFNFVCHK